MFCCKCLIVNAGKDAVCISDKAFSTFAILGLINAIFLEYTTVVTKVFKKDSDVEILLGLWRKSLEAEIGNYSSNSTCDADHCSYHKDCKHGQATSRHVILCYGVIKWFINNHCRYQEDIQRYGYNQNRRLEILFVLNE